MRKILAILMIFVAAESLAQFSPTFDTVRLRRGGKVYEVITYGEDSVKINGVMYRFDPATIGGWWQESGAAIMPDPSSKILKYPSIPTTYGPNLPGAYTPVYWDAVTGYLAKFSRTSNGSDPPLDGDTITGCGGVYVNTTEASDIVWNVDSIADICGCFVVKNMGIGSTLTLTSIEGLLFDSLASVVLNYGEWASICADSTFFVTFGTIDLAPRNGMWPLYYERDTIKINKASASDSGYLTSADWNIFNAKDTIYAKVTDYGAVGDGVTDCTAAFADAFATGKPVLVPRGTFLVDSIVAVSNSIMVGSGRNYTILKLNTGKRALLKMSNINQFRISDLSLSGGNTLTFNGSESEGTRIGIEIYGGRKNIISNVSIYNFNKSGIYSYGIGGTLGLFNSFKDLSVQSCYSGIDINSLSEYSSYYGIYIYNCLFGIRLSGGNNTISNIASYGNVVGLKMFNSSNSAHGSMVNSNFNHNKQYSIVIDTVQTLGQLFSSCNFWFGGMKIDNSPLIRFDNCRVEVDSLRIIGECAGTGFHNSFFKPSISPFIRDRSTDLTYFQNNSYTDGSTANYALINDPYPLISIDSIPVASGSGDTSVVWNPLTKALQYKIGGGGSGTVTSISQGTGMLFSTDPNPITTTGTIGIDTSKVVMFNDTLPAGKMQTKYASRNYISDPSNSVGEMLYRNSSGNWDVVAPTGSGQYLKSYLTEGNYLPQFELVTFPIAQDSTMNPWIYIGGNAVTRSVTGKVGVNRTNPTAFLEVNNSVKNSTAPQFRTYSSVLQEATPTDSLGIYVDAKGYVGVGVTNPSYVLHANGTIYASSGYQAAAGQHYSTNYNGIMYLRNTNSGSSTSVGIATYNTEAMRIDASQRVGIGTTAPTNKLHVVTTAANDTAARFWSINTSSNNYGITSYGDLHGIKAKGYTGRGIWGVGATAGVYGEGGLYGVLGASGSTAGVRGESTAGDGVQGYTSASGKYGGYFTSLYHGRGLFASTATIDSQLTVNRKATTDTAVIKRLMYTPCNTGNITAGTGITAAMLCADMRYNGNSAVDITSNPQIADGVDGQTISITCLSSTNTLRIDNGNGVQLDGGVDYTMLEGYNITLRYISSMDKWVEISRNQHYWGEP